MPRLGLSPGTRKSNLSSLQSWMFSLSFLSPLARHGPLGSRTLRRDGVTLSSNLKHRGARVKAS